MSALDFIVPVALSIAAIGLCFSAFMLSLAWDLTKDTHKDVIELARECDRLTTLVQRQRAELTRLHREVERERK